MKGDELEVRGEDLVQLVQSEPFRANLAKAARHTARTGYESGFTVYQDLESGEIVHSGLMKGAPDSIVQPSYATWARENLERPSAHGYELMTVHFHPATLEQPLDISAEDCGALDSPFPSDNLRPILGVGATDGSRGYVVFLQRAREASLCHGTAPYRAIDELADACEAELHWRDSQDDWVKSLAIPGAVRSGLLSFDLSQHHYAILGDPSFLRAFSYRTSVTPPM